MDRYVGLNLFFIVALYAGLAWSLPKWREFPQARIEGQQISPELERAFDRFNWFVSATLINSVLISLVVTQLSGNRHPILIAGWTLFILWCIFPPVSFLVLRSINRPVFDLFREDWLRRHRWMREIIGVSWVLAMLVGPVMLWIIGSR